MLPLLVIILAPAFAYSLTCHCQNRTECSANGFCMSGCDNGWYGPGCQVSNVALGKRANQSSTYAEWSGYRGVAELAVDGRVPDGSVMSATYCSHTEASQRSAWWYVTLNTTHDYVITSVTLVNRRGEPVLTDRLSDFLILYSNETKIEPDPSNNAWKLCAQERGKVDDNRTYTCINTTSAKRVAVYLNSRSDAILTLCEVQVLGYQLDDCPSGFAGPGCLLRACDEQCISTGGKCDNEYGSCHYEVCPDRSLLPPDCWITLSNYSAVNILSEVTCNTVLFSVNISDSRPNIAASKLELQVHSSSNLMMLVNTTLFVLEASKVSYNYSNASAGATYEVSVRPVYCSLFNRPCFYSTGSKVFTSTTGKRDYDFFNNRSCVIVNWRSTNPLCEPPSGVQVTCESNVVGSVTVNSSSSTLCGLEKGRSYNCSVAAVINGNTIERQTADITTEPLYESAASEKNITVVAGGIGGVLAVIVVIIVGIIAVVYCRRKRNAKSGAVAVAHDAKTNAHPPAVPLVAIKLPTSYSTTPLFEDDEQTYCNISGMKLPQFQLYVQDETLIARRFSELLANEARSCSHGTSPENKGKNRFQNILPYDINRVRLDSVTNDYINASYIYGCLRPKEYIAAQGPTPKTLEDFWHMIWQEKCSAIVMLTAYVEQAKKKCEKYFPFSKSHELDIEVTVGATTVFDTHTVTELNVRQGSELRLVHHFHFLAWPDQAVPSHSAEVLLFYSRICLHLKRLPSSGPLLVHCSAGVGRTGAYIAFDCLLQRYQTDSTVDVDSCIVNLRDQRMQMVQTKEQYVFLHKVVLYSLKTIRYIYDAAHLQTQACAGASPCSSVNVSMDTEWQELQALVPAFHEESFATAVLPENKHKNRRNDILALEFKRPIICNPDGGNQLYINAVYCNGCYSKRAYIATQLPLRGTVDDFWLMVYDCQPSCIIVLHDLPSSDYEDCPRYWPEPGHSVTADRLEVKCDIGCNNESTNEAKMPCYGISLSPVFGCLNASQTVSTKLLTSSLWNIHRSTELPANAYDLVAVANALRTYCVEAPQQPIIVQCRDGVTQSGLFLSAMNALHRLIETEQVSVFHTVELLRTSRPEFVTSEAQYRFIYQILEAYHDSANIYANT